MEESVDPLSRLVMDEAKTNRELLANVLENVVRLDVRRGTFSFLPGVRDRIRSRRIVLSALLAQQALHMLDERHPDGLAPRELEQLTGIGGGTLRPILKDCADAGLVRKDDDSSVYRVPAHALESVSGEFMGVA